MRLIDADELLRNLEEYFNKKEQDAKFTGNRGSEVSWNDAIYYIKTAPSVQPELRTGKWIPCSEILPKVRSDRKYVTVLDESGDGAFTYSSVGFYLSDGAWIVDDEPMYADDLIRVIAWMPLPEPYEKDGDKK